MNWRSNKKFSVAFLQANVNFQNEQINCQKKSNKRNPNQKKKETNQKKSSKEISMRDNSDNKKILKKCTLLNVLFYYKFYGNHKIFQIFKDKVLSTRNKQNKKILKTAKPKKIFYFKFS
jgi:hypothetical protein